MGTAKVLRLLLSLVALSCWIIGAPVAEAHNGPPRITLGAEWAAPGVALEVRGINIAPDQLQSRNVAAVIVTSTLPPASNVGDHIDATVTSIGDARSLACGTLLMTPLMGPDRKSYA